MFNGDGNGTTKAINYPKIIGVVALNSSIQFSIASAAMSSVFSVINFSKEQDILDNAADSLRGYMYIAAIWTMGNMLIQGSQSGRVGAIIALIGNLICISWIYASYIYAFKTAAKKYNLKEPKVWRLTVTA